MEYRIEHLSEKKLVGKHSRMSFAENKTAELWRSFMPLRKEIKNSTGTDLYSLQLYPVSFFDSFNPHTSFEKWAAMAVSSFDNIPSGMEAFTLESGLYAVFNHKGSNTDNSTFEYIFTNWLPNSTEHVLDNRPHFEVLGDKYKNGDPASEEEIWIPVKLKNK